MLILIQLFLVTNDEEKSKLLVASDEEVVEKNPHPCLASEKSEVTRVYEKCVCNARIAKIK